MDEAGETDFLHVVFDDLLLSFSEHGVLVCEVTLNDGRHDTEASCLLHLLRDEEHIVVVEAIVRCGILESGSGSELESGFGLEDEIWVRD